MAELTKKALLQAFGEMLEKKAFDKITVSDITKRCGLNRMTFYYHFKDIYELIIWGFKTYVLEASRDYLSYDSWKTGYLRLFTYALEKKSYITKIFLTIEEEHLEHHLIKIAEGAVLSVIEDRCKGVSVKPEDKAFTAEVCAHVLVGVLVNWVKRGMKEDPELIIQKLGCLLDGCIEKTINGFSTKA